MDPSLIAPLFSITTTLAAAAYSVAFGGELVWCPR